VTVDVLTARGEAYAVEILKAVSLDAHAEGRIRRAEAGMVLGTVLVLVARHAAIDALLILAREAENAVEPRVTARRGLDAAHALLRYVHALSALKTRHAAAAGAAARKDALLDRFTLVAIAS
jgi:hypothetical protein